MTTLLWHINCCVWEAEPSEPDRPMPRARSAQMDTLAIELHGARIALKGALGVRTLPELDHALARQHTEKFRPTLDLGALNALDTSAALFLSSLRAAGTSLTGLSPEHRALIDFVGKLELQPLPKMAPPARWRQLVIHAGRGVEAARLDAYEVLGFVGRAVNSVGSALTQWRRLRPASISRH